jgi:hypothetical protein
MFWSACVTWILNYILVFWLSLVWLLSSVNLCLMFLLNFCLNFDKFFFWFWGDMTQNMLGMTPDLKPTRFIWFYCDCVSFFFPFEKWIFVFFINSFQKCSKNFNQNLYKNWANNFEFWHFFLRLLRLSEVKKVLNG